MIEIGPNLKQAIEAFSGALAFAAMWWALSR